MSEIFCLVSMDIEGKVWFCGGGAGWVRVGFEGNGDELGLVQESEGK